MYMYAAEIIPQWRSQLKDILRRRRCGILCTRCVLWQ